MENHYPTTGAVYTFVTTTLENMSYMKADFSNASTWEPLYVNDEYKYLIPSNDDQILETTGSFYPYYQYYSGINLNASKALTLLVSFSNVIITPIYSISPRYSYKNLSQYSPLHYKGTAVEFTSTYDESTGLYINEIVKSRDAINSEWFDPIYDNINGETVVIDPQGAGEYPFDENIIVEHPLLIQTLSVTSSPEQTLLKFECIPNKTSETFVTTSVTIQSTIPSVYDIENENYGTLSNGTAEIQLYYEPLITLLSNGANLLKRDLSNLPGMSEKDKLDTKNKNWRINTEDTFPDIKQETIADIENTNIALNKKVAEAIIKNRNYIRQLGGIPSWEANKEYITIPDVSKVLYNGDIYYCLRAHTSGSSFDTSKWRRVFNSTYEYTANKNTDMSIDPTNATKFPTNSAVAKYVKEQIDAVHVPGHYHGQVAIMVLTEASLPPATNPEYPNIQVSEGLTALVENYNSTNKPAIATYTSSAWVYEEITLQNGIYVYVLNLGTSYDNGPGTATWNDDTDTFDIAPDKFQVPDGITLNINESTGAIQIVPSLQQKLEYVDVNGSIQDSLDEINDHLAQLDSSLGAMIIPNPQFFTGTNTVGQQLVISDDVAFDLYINGQFQYPNTYTYTASSKTITLNFAVENTVSNGIAVIYRGFRTL